MCLVRSGGQVHGQMLGWPAKYTYYGDIVPRVCERWAGSLKKDPAAIRNTCGPYRVEPKSQTSGGNITNYWILAGKVPGSNPATLTTGLLWWARWNFEQVFPRSLFRYHSFWPVIQNSTEVPLPQFLVGLARDLAYYALCYLERAFENCRLGELSIWISRRKVLG